MINNGLEISVLCMRFLMSVSLVCLLMTYGCNMPSSEDLEKIKLVNYEKSDTTQLEIVINKAKFHGTYTFSAGAGYSIVGELDGEVKGDSLIGSLFYTPYKWLNKKRKAFALLKKEDHYVGGTGAETIYMGIPYFNERTLEFDGSKYQLVK